MDRTTRGVVDNVISYRKESVTEMKYLKRVHCSRFQWTVPAIRSFVLDVGAVGGRSAGERSRELS